MIQTTCSEHLQPSYGIDMVLNNPNHKRTLKVLLIDDEPEILDCLSAALALKGFSSKQFCDPKEAIDTYKREKFDVVITDFKMSEMNGIEVMEAIRAHDPNTRVIIISGYAENYKAEMGESEGIYAVLQKPMELRKLLDTLYKIEEELRDIHNH